MNNESPLIPQGSLLDQKNKGRARVKIAVFVVLAIHGVGLMFLLMVGCKPSGPTPEQIAATNTPPVFEPATNVAPAPETNVAPPTAATTNPVPVPTPPLPEPTPTISTPTSTAVDYKVMKGDTLGKIAHNHHVTLPALQNANPGVDSTKLKVDQVIHIPSSSAPASTSTPGVGTPTAETADSGKTWTVKSGDNLLKIAHETGTSVKGLRAANHLKTDKIRVGQVLKIPAKASTASSAAPMVPPAISAPEPSSPGTSGPSPTVPR